MEQPAKATVRAAQYLRMSSNPQQLSIPMQKHANGVFAEARGYEIVATYEDPGLSGLTIDRRPGLQRLLADVVAGSCPFAAILVHDVSRWGRFQDPDEAAHYEFLCRAAGISVQYTAETFANDSSPASALIKQLKRIMAAEFSVDLSAKIRRVHLHLHEQGFFRGGSAPYAMLRQQVSPDGRVQRVLEPGERKSFPTSRIVLIPGPAQQVAVVRRIFRQFVSMQRLTVQIAADLNADGIPSRTGAGWTPSNVRSLLANEVYAGTSVLGKEQRHLNRIIRRAPPSEWSRKPGAIPAIVSRATWTKAHELLSLGRRRYVSDTRLLDDLRALHAEHGRLTARLIADARGYSPFLYQRRFGSLTEAYVQAGFGHTETERRAQLRAARPADTYRRKPFLPDDVLLAKLRTVFVQNGKLSYRIVETADDCPSLQTFRARFGGMRLAYALVGYEPSRYQDLQMEARGQAITVEEARQIRQVANASDLGFEGPIRSLIARQLRP